MAADAAADATTDELARQFSELAELSGEERRAALAEMPPERRLQLQEYNKKIARGMADINTMLKLLKPLDNAPDEPVHTLAVLASLACCPGMSPIGGEAEPDHLQPLETAIVAHATETDTNAYRDVHDKIPPGARNTLLLLLWLMYQARLEAEGFKLAGDLGERCEIASNVAIRILIQSQRAVVEMQWVQPALALYRTSAILGNGLWSGSDPTCLSRMRAILASDHLSYPEVSLQALAHAGLTGGGGAPERVPFLAMEALAAAPPGRIHPNKPVYLEIEITRAHAQDALNGRPAVAFPAASSGSPPKVSASAGAPPAVLEAYWLIVEGVKADPEPNPMVHHQPMVVTSVAADKVRARVRFAAPGPGEYSVRVHVISSSVAGMEIQQQVGFTVEEDDVPELR